MREAVLECIQCRSTFEGPEDVSGCPTCGNPVQILVDSDRLRFDDLAPVWRGRPFGVWRYRELLPMNGGGEVSLQEGGTALLRVAVLEGVGSEVATFVKNEGQNPTGSFKDRGMTVGVSRARSLGRRRVICASTGNTAASLAAYAARAGIECLVLVPAGGVAQGKLAQARFHGAKVIALRGSFDDAMRVVVPAAKALDAYVLNSINPYRIEGQKTAAFEIFEQLGERVPDVVVCPVGNGGNLAAYGKAFQELEAIGATDRSPRLIGVQAEGSAPIADSILRDLEGIVPVPHPTTVASAIRIGSPANWSKTLRAIRESGGTAVTVPDSAILEAQRLLATREGIFVEPASAASIAGAIALAREGALGSSKTIVCVATGHGLKDPEAVLSSGPEMDPVAPTVEAISSALAGGSA